MPTFDFQCTACDHLFEVTLPFGSKDKPACPACKSRKTEKQIRPPAIQFKGSGFYKSDSTASAEEPKHKNTKPKESTASKDTKPAPDTPSASPKAQSS